ncbi:hypothetical protein N5K55_21635 [Pseudomonas aeruginosa]|nr:hypothetical protein [Pseudomonas aeruginosa]
MHLRTNLNTQTVRKIRRGLLRLVYIRIAAVFRLSETPKMRMEATATLEKPTKKQGAAFIILFRQPFETP